MEHTLSFKLLGTPTIKVDGNIKIFSFSKINALLYYMVINKQISRDEIAGILWPSKDEKVPRRICEIQFIKQIARWEGNLLFHRINLF